MAILNKTKITDMNNPLKNLNYVNIAREMNIINKITRWAINNQERK